MKIELVKYDVLKILLKHLGITDYNDNIDPEDSDSRKRKIELHHDEIYWEGNPESDKVESETKQTPHKN